MKKFRRIILNANYGKSVVQKFNRGDMKHPIHEVVYAMPTLSALTYYYMQFILKDFMWEKYPRYIEGTVKSSKVYGVFYYDKIEDVIIRSSPYCGGEKWRFHKKPKKSVLPERKKHLVLKKGENYAVTSGEIDRSSGKVIDITRRVDNRTGNKTATSSVSVEGNKVKVAPLRKKVFGGTKPISIRPVQGVREGEQPLKVVAECSHRPKLKRRKDPYYK